MNLVYIFHTASNSLCWGGLRDCLVWGFEIILWGLGWFFVLFETTLKIVGLTLFYIHPRANYSGDMGNSLTKQ